MAGMEAQGKPVTPEKARQSPILNSFAWLALISLGGAVIDWSTRRTIFNSFWNNKKSELA